MSRAKEILSSGGVIVYPTETLYGLGVNPFDENAIHKVFNIKKRPLNLPISVAVSNIEMITKVAELNNESMNICKRFLPGPFTLILKKKPIIPNLLTSNKETIGVRVPDQNFTLNLIQEFGPITSTSANIHGYDLPTNIEIAKKQLGEYVNLYIDRGESKYKSPSTIIDVENRKILREGPIPISLEELYE